MLRDVTAVAATIEKSELAGFLDMEPEQLLAVVLSPVSFSPGPTPTSPRMATLCSNLGASPWMLVACCLVSHRVWELVEDLIETSLL